MQYYYYYSSTIVSIPASKALKRETLSTFAANGILEPIDGNLSSVPCNMGKPNTKSISRYFGRTFHTSAHICTVQPSMVPTIRCCSHSFSHSMDNSYSFAALFDNLYLLSYFAVYVWRYRYPTSDYRARVNLDNTVSILSVQKSRSPEYADVPALPQPARGRQLSPARVCQQCVCFIVAS